MSDLIERLRDAAARKWPDPDVARHSLFAEAADTIARLESERDAARSTLDDMLMLRELPPIAAGETLRAAVERLIDWEAAAIRAAMQGEGK
jgi:hypothetical protein